jgi:ABC-type transporter Mla MlaB component
VDRSFLQLTMKGESRLARPEEPPTTSASTPSPAPGVTIDVVIVGPVTRAAIAGLCLRVRAMLEGSGADLLICDVSAVSDPDACTIDALARMQLTARRLGRQVQLRHAHADLQALVALMGLGDVLPLYGPLRLEPGRQAEEGEEARGVEEEADPDDPAG